MVNIESERISTGKAARICGLTKPTMLRLAKAGKVPGAAELVPKLWRFDVAQLREWVREREASCRQKETTFSKGTEFGGREFTLPVKTSAAAYEQLLGLKHKRD